MNNQDPFQQEWQDIQESVIVRALSDPIFKQELINQPKEVIQRETGILFPESWDLRVVEEGPNDLYIVMPDEETLAALNEAEEPPLSDKPVSEFTEEDWETLEARIMIRAARDSDFRKILSDNPREAYEQELGESIPEEINIQVLESSDTVGNLLIPPNIELEDAANMSEEEFEDLVGLGKNPFPPFTPGLILRSIQSGACTRRRPGRF